jgi:3-methyladenine DNA glycosylase Tag
MPVHIIDPQSKSDCQELISRIKGTLSAVKPSILGRVTHYPKPFLQNDTYIFEQLTPAVMSNGTKYYLLKPHLPALKVILFGYDIGRTAALSDSVINALFLTQIQPLRIPSKIKLERKLLWIRDNAKTFLKIQRSHGSVWHFLEANLGGTPFNHAHGCFIHPNDDRLIKYLTALSSKYKLSGVGQAICCEFFNSIGIDEFKPDRHTIRFLNRVGILKSRSTDQARQVGITIAKTLGQPRKYVDSHIWVFCADGEGEICTENNPRCHVCQLKNQQLQLCQGY